MGKKKDRNCLSVCDAVMTFPFSTLTTRSQRLPLSLSLGLSALGVLGRDKATFILFFLWPQGHIDRQTDRF